jgi:hypothetical protein
VSRNLRIKADPSTGQTARRPAESRSREVVADRESRRTSWNESLDRGRLEPLSRLHAAPWQPHQLISGRAQTARTKILHARGSSAGPSLEIYRQECPRRAVPATSWVRRASIRPQSDVDRTNPPALSEANGATPNCRRVVYLSRDTLAPANRPRAFRQITAKLGDRCHPQSIMTCRRRIDFLRLSGLEAVPGIEAESAFKETKP